MDTLKRVDTGLALPEVCHELGIRSATFYIWRAKYGGMDFMHDQLQDGRALRLFSTIHDFNRETLGVEMDFSLSVEQVVRSLDQNIAWRDKSCVTGGDNGPEIVSDRLMEWAQRYQIHIQHI